MLVGGLRGGVSLVCKLEYIQYTNTDLNLSTRHQWKHLNTTSAAARTLALDS
jgi:hypothetical protein